MSFITISFQHVEQLTAQNEWEENDAANELPQKFFHWESFNGLRLFSILIYDIYDLVIERKVFFTITEIYVCGKYLPNSMY